VRNFLKEWDKIKKDLRGKHLYLFLDFDGTLTAIRRRPEAVKLGKSTGDILKKLVSEKDISVAIISGRKLKEARKLVGIKDIIYAGNHGLETEGPDVKFTVPEAAKAKKLISLIRKKLEKELRLYEGVLVEDKTLTLSVHYRMARKSKVKEIERVFKNITIPYKSSGRIAVTKGKKVWEVRPPVRWNKGNIAAHLLGQKKKKLKKRIVSFYIGDDKTDEDAFRKLRRGSYTVKVGKGKTRASYCLQDIKEVRKFLKDLLTIRKRGGIYV
jgi:trehalose-phosphatase